MGRRVAPSPEYKLKQRKSIIRMVFNREYIFLTHLMFIPAQEPYQIQIKNRIRIPIYIPLELIGNKTVGKIYLFVKVSN